MCKGFGKDAFESIPFRLQDCRILGVTAHDNGFHAGIQFEQNP
jgi:hypothetical protein